MRKLFIAAGLLLALTSCGPKWETLFNGQDLTGWNVQGGKAEFSVEDGVLVGTRVCAGGSNTFIVTDKTYSDFILEFDFKIDLTMNSGVQLRSRTEPWMTGYQFELDPSANPQLTGGIYDEARRGWLYPMTYNQDARNSEKPGEWNHGRVEAIGNNIRTFVNGVECANLLDAVDSEGVIAFQVHMSDDSTTIGSRAMWKDIRICTENPSKFATPQNPDVYQKNWIDNTLSERQISDGWKLLFDGTSMDGWKSARADGLPTEGWTVSNGMLQVWENGGAESLNGGDIVTVDMYENFWLSVDFKLTPGANSGIKYFVRPDLYPVADASAIGCEFQILDDELHPDAKLGTNGNRTLASLYDLIPSDKANACFNKAHWNTAWVIVKGNHVEHWLNGVKVVEYDRNTQMFNALVARSKYVNWANFGNHDKGRILLQEHGNHVCYKNVMIKVL